MTSDEPQTMAGKALLAAPTINLRKAIIRIEQEADAIDLERLAKAIADSGLIRPDDPNHGNWYEMAARVATAYGLRPVPEQGGD